MRRRLLQFLAMFTFRQAAWIFPLVALVTWFAVDQGLRCEFDTSLGSFMPPASAEGRLIRELMGDYRKLEPVMAVLSAREDGHEMDLAAMARDLARWLDNQAFFSMPVYRAEPDDPLTRDHSLTRLAQLLPPEDWRELPERMRRQFAETAARREAPHEGAGKTPRPPAAGAAAKNAGRKQLPMLSGDLITSSLLQALNGRIAASRGPTRMPAREGYYMSPDGRSLLMLLYPSLSPEDGGAALNTMRFTRRCASFVLERHPELRGRIDINFYGSIISTGEHIQKMASELALILRFAVPLAFLLCLLVFRKLESLFFIAIPPAIGLAWTLGLARLLFGGVTGVTLIFLLIIAAIGIEYTIHMCHRFTLELYRTRHYYRALTRSYVETGRGILTTAILMALLFLMLFGASLGSLEPGQSWLTVFDARGFARLGMVAGLGIVCNLLACLLALPLMAAVKHALARGAVKRVRLFDFGLKRLSLPAIQTPRLTLLVMLLTALVLGFDARQLDFSPNFAAISPFFYRLADPGEAATKNEFQRPGRPVVAVVSGKTMQEGLEYNDRLEANLRASMGEFPIAAYDSLRWSLPSLATQKAGLAWLNKLDPETVRRQMPKAFAGFEIPPGALEAPLRALKTAQAAAAKPAWIIFGTDQPDGFVLNVQRHITRQNGRYYVATVIYPAAQGFSPEMIPALQRRLGHGLPELSLVGDPITERALSRLIKVNLALLSLLSVFSVAIALLIHFRQLRRALIAFVPILMALLGVCGGMAMAGLKIHFFTVMALPLILCMAVDHAVQLAQYYFDHPAVSVRVCMQSLGRVTPLSASIMGLFFGTLTLTSYDGLRDFGATLLIGMISILASVLMLLPALLRLFGAGQSLWQALFMEPGEQDAKY